MSPNEGFEHGGENERLAQELTYAKAGLDAETAGRERAEAEVRRLARIVQDSNDAVTVQTFDGKILVWNRGAERMYGYSQAEALQLNAYDMVADDLRQETEDVIEAIRAGAAVDSFETRRVAKDGTVLDVSLTVTLVSNAAGYAEAVATTERDITERNQVREEIRRRNAELAAINQVFREALTCDTEAEVFAKGLVVAEELTGSKFGFIGELNEAGLFDTAAISNPGWDACTMPGTQAAKSIKNMAIRGTDRTVLREGESRIVNDPASHPDRGGTPEGHPPVTSFLGVPLKHAGRTIGMIGLANKEGGYDLADQDAVEALATAIVEALMRKRAEEELRRIADELRETTVSRDYVDNILRSMNDSLLVLTPQGTIQTVNCATCSLLGYEEDELVGRPARMLLQEEEEEEEEEEDFAEFSIADGTLPFKRTVLRRLVNDGFISNIETFYLAEDGRTIPVLFSGAVMRDSNDTVEGIVCVAQDITERKQKEKELRRAQADAEAASEAKSEFLASMSHELRTPLNGVIAMNELLLGMPLDEKARRYAWLAKTSGDLLLSLINDILDFSKIEAGKLELETTDFDLRYAVESIALSLASRAEGKGLELVCSVHPHVPTLLRGDPGRLQQVVMNLTNNAIKFTEQGEVAIRVVKDDETPQHATIRCTVTDTGVGIPPDRRDRLFRSFSQVDASTTRKFGGTGLGLAISKQICELMGGQIGVESEPGRGSTFWFTVKLEKQPAAQPQQRPTLDDLHHMRILAVDDNDTNREILREQLTDFGLSNETAPSGERALSTLREAITRGAPFGLAVLDMQMPEMDGEQLAQAIKADPTLKDTVLVLLTSGGECDPERLRSLGFAGWLTKPVRQSQLLDAIVEATLCASARPHHRDRNIDRQTSASAHPVHQAKSPGARILLAEDNDISQEAAAELLKRAGYHCNAVADGKQAVEAALRERYDLVLMDCQMPNMDGFDATRAIRQHEESQTLSGGQRRRLPIIALTANAIKGDRERCLEAGMDDYLTKPLDPDRLVQVIKMHLSADAERPEASLHPPANEAQVEQQLDEAEEGRAAKDAPPPFDVDAMLKRWGNDRKFVERFITKFRERAPDDLEKLRQAVTAGEVEEATRLAHGLKGAAGYVAAERVRELAGKLETMGRDGDLSEAEDLLMQLQSELTHCVDSSPDILLEMAHESEST